MRPALEAVLQRQHSTSDAAKLPRWEQDVCVKSLDEHHNLHMSWAALLPDIQVAVTRNGLATRWGDSALYSILSDA